MFRKTLLFAALLLPVIVNNPLRPGTVNMAKGPAFDCYRSFHKQLEMTGIDPTKAKVSAPASQNFQEERSFAPLRMTGSGGTGIVELNVKAKEGWMLVIDKQ